MFNNIHVNKLWYIHTMELLLSNNRQWTIHKSLDGSQNNYAEQKKPDQNEWMKQIL